jgi:hypothetical protein
MRCLVLGKVKYLMLGKVNIKRRKEEENNPELFTFLTSSFH